MASLRSQSTPFNELCGLCSDPARGRGGGRTTHLKLLRDGVNISRPTTRCGTWMPTHNHAGMWQSWLDVEESERISRSAG